MKNKKILVVVIAITAIITIETFSKKEVNAGSVASNFQHISTEKTIFGSLVVYVDKNTRIGYTVVLDQSNKPMGGMTQLTNVMGEPQRYDTKGNVMTRLEKEIWRDSEGITYWSDNIYSSIYTN